MKIEDYLHEGAAAAITAAELAKLLHIETREVQKHVQAARLRGIPICASNTEPYGLYIAETPEELERYLKSFNRRLKAMNNTGLALGDTLAEMTGQQSLF